MIATEIKNTFAIEMLDYIKENEEEPEKISEQLQKLALDKYQEKEEEIGSEDLRELERVVLLKVVDEKWMDHIDNMDELKNGIGLRAYGQQDPVVKYRTEGGDMFDEMNADIKSDVTKIMMNIRKQGELKRHETVRITKQKLVEMIHVHVVQEKSIRIVVEEINKSLKALIPRAFLISKMQLIFRYVIGYVLKKVSKMYLERILKIKSQYFQYFRKT